MKSVCRTMGRWLLAVVVLGTGGTATVARADNNIRSELSIVAKGINDLLKDRGQSQVEVREFQFKSTDARVTASAGPGIANFLSEELKKLQISVQKGAPIQIDGQYDDVIDSRSKTLSARIRGQVLDENGKVISTFSRGIFGDQALASIFGVTTNLAPKGTLDERSKALEKALDNPTVNVQNTRISVDSSTPYALEILVNQGGKYVPRAATTVNGQAFVKINRGEEYAIHLVNDSDQEAAVALTIDGLSMFAFSDNKEYQQMVVPAKTKGLIRGWHRSNTASDAFLVTEYSKSAVAQALPSSTSVGVITAAFSVCHPKDVPPPDDEPKKGMARSANFTEDATGRGRKIDENFNEVQREFGVVRTTISVRYTK